jgi:DNA-binding MarR family transcriptional regulator
MRMVDPTRVLRIIGDLDRLLIGVLDPILKASGLGREHWQLLRLLADGHGHPMGEITDAVGLAGATATRVVDSLAERMLVYRRSDPVDRRRVLVHLSGAGYEALDRVQEAFSGQASSALERLDYDEYKSLAALVDRFTADADDASG